MWYPWYSSAIASFSFPSGVEPRQSAYRLIHGPLDNSFRIRYQIPFCGHAVSWYIYQLQWDLAAQAHHKTANFPIHIFWRALRRFSPDSYVVVNFVKLCNDVALPYLYYLIDTRHGNDPTSCCCHMYRLLLDNSLDLILVENCDQNCDIRRLLRVLGFILID